MAVAQELSFSKAAIKLHMSQPPLSQQIKALEESMGVQLLDRSRREVHLTEAGKVFLVECKAILSSLQQAVGVSVRAASLDAGKIRVGFVTTALIHILPSLHARISTRFPEVELSIYDMSSRDQIEGILAGRLDIGIIHSCPDTSGVNKVPVYSEPFVLAVPEGHALATDGPLDASTLEKYPLIGFSRDHSPSLYDAQVACCLARGFRPNLVHSVRTPFSVFQLIRLGLGISLVPRPYAKSNIPGVVFRELDGSTGHLHLYVVWKDSHVPDLVNKVVEGIMLEPLVD